MSEYPTDKQLEDIKEWEVTNINSFHMFMGYIYSYWNFSEWGWHKNNNVYEISTGGWSGNEDIINAMMENTMFWIMYWQQSRRGGHYIFCPVGEI